MTYFFRLRGIPWVSYRVVLGLLLAQEAFAEEVNFNSTFLPVGSQSLDLQPYQNAGSVTPGQYRADVWVNERSAGRLSIRIQSPGKICVSIAMLELIAVDVEKLESQTGFKVGDDDICRQLGELIDGAQALFLVDSQRLEVSVPQIWLRRMPLGYVDPKLWDHGVSAAVLGYQFNANHSRFDTGRYDSVYTGLNMGINFNEWRLRHNGSLSWDSYKGHDYQVINTYLQRDVTALKSQFTLGEANTSGEVFDTLAYRGAQLASDDRMLPQSLRSYAPEVRGVARTAARVEVRQAGNLLREVNVAPGAFTLDDLYPTGFGGDLEVKVVEADGSEQFFSVPYAATAQLLRPGAVRFSLTAGETRNNFISDQVPLAQGTFQYGLTNTTTVYTGGQATDDYQAVLGGLAFNTRFGSMAADLAQAQTQLPSGSERGQSLRLTYSKQIGATGSHFAVATQRFSTRGFLDFNNALQLIDAEEQGVDTALFARPRSRMTFTANQHLGDYGQIAFSGINQRYWDLPGSDVQYQLSYSKHYKGLNFGLSAARTRAYSSGLQNNVLFTLSFPLDWGRGGASPQVAARIGRENGVVSQQVALSGSSGKAREYSYGLSAGRASGANSLDTSLNAQYRGPQSTVSSTLSQGQGYDSLSLGLSGSVIAHPQGVTLSPHSGETVAVISAPGAKGARVVGYPGLQLDKRGYAVVPYLRPYQLNEVAIDPSGIALDVELEETSHQISPRAGAIALVQYRTVGGQAFLIDVSLPDGSPLPFASAVKDRAGTLIGTVGQGGQLYVRVKEKVDELHVSWGQEPHQHCALALPEHTDETSALRRLNAVCGGQGAPVTQERNTRGNKQ